VCVRGERGGGEAQSYVFYDGVYCRCHADTMELKHVGRQHDDDGNQYND
jgi:hypothetical protein